MNDLSHRAIAVRWRRICGVASAAAGCDVALLRLADHLEAPCICTTIEPLSDVSYRWRRICGVASAAAGCDVALLRLADHLEAPCICTTIEPLSDVSYRWRRITIEPLNVVLCRWRRICGVVVLEVGRQMQQIRLGRGQTDRPTRSLPIRPIRLIRPIRPIPLQTHFAHNVAVPISESAHPFASLMTPAFLVDRDVVARNCDAMREKALASGVGFRPHVKTHKVAEIGRMQHGGKTGPITVSTLAEGDYFAAEGFRDITYAVPIAASKLERAAMLASRVDRLNLLIDSEQAMRAVEEFSTRRGVSFGVFLKVDCGYHRAGVDPASPDSVRLALAMAASESVRFEGLLTHAGHSYAARDVEEVRRIAAEEAASLSRFRALLAAEGLGETLRSVGSTPTTSVVERFSECDEVRPGNYVFFDAFQATLGSCRRQDVAISVLTTVVGSYPERNALILDAGALALSKDRGADHLQPDCGYGLVCDVDLRPLPMQIEALSQEHGKVKTSMTVPVGTKLRVLPNHSCLTAAMFSRYHVVSAGAIVDEWRPASGW